MRKTVDIALLGCGVVGGGVAELLLRDRARIEALTGVRCNLKGIAVRSLEKHRTDANLPAELFTTNARKLIADPDVDLVIECIGGRDAASEYVEQALEHHKHVVTANKDLLATDGPRLFALAAGCNATLQYEAAVGGAVPVVRAIGESLAAEEVFEVAGIMNGTTNFILTAMHDGKSYAEALAQAQELGFAEADPTSDVEAYDAAHKLAILCQLAFHASLISPRIARRGITEVTPDDITRAKRLNAVVKLVAYARKNGDAIAAEVAPVFVPVTHAFAQPQGPENVVRVVGRSSGPLTLFGQGAGRFPTASAIIGDTISAIRAIAAGSGSRHYVPLQSVAAVTPAYSSFEQVTSGKKTYPLWSDTTERKLISA